MFLCLFELVSPNITKNIVEDSWTLGLSQVSKLWFVVSMGMLPVKSFAT